jgi:GGDEF domain-containing protein
MGDAWAIRALVKAEGPIHNKLKELNDPATADLSLSAGLASYPDDATTADDLVRLADISLYSSKLGKPKAAQKV